MMRRHSLNCLSFFAALSAMFAGANACMKDAPFVIEDVKLADVVFQGDVERYSVKGCALGETRTLFCYSLIDVSVTETFYGEKRDHWTLYWWNSTFGVPDDWEYEKSMIFAGRWEGSARPPLRGPSATVYASERPELLQVLQAPCSTPFILEPSPGTVAKVRSLVDEKSADEKD